MKAQYLDAAGFKCKGYLIMEMIHVVILALIQGITEFLPISSSAHLILPNEILGWPDQGLAFDVAVHLGTLFAVVVYFRKDVLELFLAWSGSIRTRSLNDSSRLAWAIIVATIPAGLAGLLFNDLIETHLRSMSVIAATTLFFGFVLGLADYYGKGSRSLASITLTLALVIGLAQALALIPGTSRSGITITAALFLGFSRTESARFSFLISIPIIVLSGGLKGLELLGESYVDWMSLAIGAAVSAVSAYICIYYFLSFINRLGMMPFVIYRLVLGVILIAIIWT